jgi:hypothetical protein
MGYIEKRAAQEMDRDRVSLKKLNETEKYQVTAPTSLQL